MYLCAQTRRGDIALFIALPILEIYLRSARQPCRAFRMVLIPIGIVLAKGAWLEQLR
jgi:hypothetical protein